MAREPFTTMSNPIPDQLHTPALHADSSIAAPPVLELSRQNTTSSIGSAQRLPTGHWAINVSGNCSRCHRHHNSLQVHIRVSEDSTQVGDVHCNKCERLWLAFGRNNSTRLSLLSIKSIEPEPLDTTFHNTVVHIIRSTTPVAALSSTLTVIPEAASVGPSRETSVRSDTRGAVQGNTVTPVCPSISTSHGVNNVARNDRDAIGSTPTTARHQTTAKKRLMTKCGQLFVRAKKQIGTRFPKLHEGLLRQWAPQTVAQSSMSKGEELSRESFPSNLASKVSISTACDGNTQTPGNGMNNQGSHSLDACTPSTSATEALDTLRVTGPQAVRTLSPSQRVEWARQQLTSFKYRKASPAQSIHTSTMVDTGVPVEPSAMLTFPEPSPRRYSDPNFAFMGSNFGTWEYIYGTPSALNGRPFSMSEPHLSDVDTAVEGRSVLSAPRHILIESLQRDRRGSGSPRPRSFHSVGQDWQQIHRNRAEARRSVDSAATGAAVRSIVATRGRLATRVSRASIGRSPTPYGTEPSRSELQLPLPTEGEYEPSNEP